MKINVAVHIPLFNILSVRQTYCLSIAVAVVLWRGCESRLCPPSLLCLRHLWWLGQCSLSYGWEHAGLRFAYMLNKSKMWRNIHRFSFSSSGFTHVRTTNVSKQANGNLLFWEAPLKSPPRSSPIWDKNKKSDLGSHDNKSILIIVVIIFEENPCNLLRVF